MKIVFIQCLLFLNLYGLTGFCQTTGTNSISIEIIPENPVEQLADGVRINFLKDVVSGSYGFKWIPLEAGHLPGTFRITLPVESQISRLYFIFTFGAEDISSNAYYPEPADHLKITYKKSKKPISLTFSGRGSEKCKVIDLMEKEMDKLIKATRVDTAFKNDTRPFWDKIRDKYGIDCHSEKFNSIFDHWFRDVDSYKKSVDSILQKNSKLLSSDMKEFLRYELDRTEEETRVRFLAYYDYAKTKECKEFIAKMYLSNLGPSRLDINNPLLKHSLLFVRNYNKRVMTELFFRNKGERYPFSKQYAFLKATANQDLRDRLITEFLLSSSLQYYASDLDSRDSCREDAYNVVKSPILLNALKEQFLFSAGSKMYSFSIPDSTGKIVSLNDFKGKVFLIDVWFEGCTGCLTFSQMFKKEIYPKFANHPDFKVLSLNMTKDKERIESALKSGKYTQDDFINLYIGKEGVNHPLLKYFNAEKFAFPFVLLVDKNGRIARKIGVEESGPTIDLIQKLLDQK